MTINQTIAPFLILALLGVLFLLRKTEKNWEEKRFRIFECGFTSYFYSRYSFSIQYFLIRLVFLFLDLELCFIIPMISERSANIKIYTFLTIFLIVLLIGLLEEWRIGALQWND